jgi:hypothetical protein
LDKIRPEILLMFDEWAVNGLMDDYGYDGKEALELFLGSQTRSLLDDYDTGLWCESPLVIYDLLKQEIETGTPYNSTYLKGDEFYANPAG